MRYQQSLIDYKEGESSEALIIGNSFLANITLSSDAGEEKFKELRDYGQTYYEMYGIWATFAAFPKNMYEIDSVK